MKTSDILVNVMNKKGQFGHAKWSKNLKTRKGITHTVTKKTQMSIRAGIDYDNLKAVKEKREDGRLPEINQKLPWGQWIAFPYLIEHKGNHYIRLYPSGRVETSYFLNGKPVEMEQIEEFVLASELPKENSEKPDCITVNLENIEELV